MIRYKLIFKYEKNELQLEFPLVFKRRMSVNFVLNNDYFVGLRCFYLSRHQQAPHLGKMPAHEGLAWSSITHNRPPKKSAK
jgi:hypothetical protein